MRQSEMGVRESICSCGATVLSGSRGKIPEFCAECRYARQIEASKRWKQRNGEHLAEYRRVTHAENREAENARSRAWHDANREHAAVYRRRIYLERQQATNTAAVAEYRRRNPGKHAEIENRRRARLLDAFVAPVDPAAIRARDRGLCGICGIHVALEDQSLDHVIPLAAGGTHEPSNVQLAHRVCNSRKGAKPLRVSA